jgi:hypothetical protein
MGDQKNLIILTILMLAVSLVGTLVNAGMLAVSVRRRWKVGGVDEISRLATARAEGIEAAFLLCQVILLLISVWALWAFDDTFPQTPPGAVPYYAGSLVGRTLVSAILATISLTDLLRRGQTQRLLDLEEGRQEERAHPQPETTQPVVQNH